MQRPCSDDGAKEATVARDVFIQLHRCQYCNRPGFVFWDEDLFSCGEEVCKTLAFAEVRRRHHDRGSDAPEKKLATALLRSLDTLEYAVRADEREEVLEPDEAEAIRQRERLETAYLLSELRALAKRYPTPARSEREQPAPSPRYRRFVRPGRTIPLRRRRPTRAAA
jgi:hypothetical protein